MDSQTEFNEVFRKEVDREEDMTEFISGRKSESQRGRHKKIFTHSIVDITTFKKKKKKEKKKEKGKKNRRLYF